MSACPSRVLDSVQNLLLVLLAACGQPAAGPEPAPTEPPNAATAPEPPATNPAPAPSEPTPPAPEAALPESPVLLRAEGDLVGDAAPETVTLYADGTLVAGPGRATVELTGADEYWMTEQARLQIVRVHRDPPIRGVLVSLPIADDEDPPSRHRLYLLDDATLRLALDITPGTYGAIDLVFPGDGTMHYIEDGWSACERLHHPARPVVRDEVVWRLDGEAMRESERRPTRQRQDCSQLAACPFVYVLDGERAAFAGEILRNLRGFDAYALQELSLPAGADHGVRVRLTEEKDEVTYLDEVYLEVDGVRYEPAACATQSALFCLADHRPLVMRRGDSLDLAFDAPPGDAVLYARGYYVPTAN